MPISTFAATTAVACCYCLMQIQSTLAFTIAPSTSTFTSTFTYLQQQQQQQQQQLRQSLTFPLTTRLNQASFDEEDNKEVEEEEKKVNPYADPNYPDLEFIDYSDPEYQADRGQVIDGDEDSNDSMSTEEEVESMREHARRKNDEFQFQTFFQNILKNGDDFKGEWTLYKTSTFLNSDDDDDKKEEESMMPRLHKAAQTFLVQSKGSKKFLKENEKGDNNIAVDDFAVSRERILHEELLVSDEDVLAQYNLEQANNKNGDTTNNDDSDGAKSSSSSKSQGTTTTAATTTSPSIQQELMDTKYWPQELCFADFRGTQGIMCVSNAYTVGTAVRLAETTTTSTHNTNGPFSEYRTELGLTTDQLRFRIKLDYAIVPEETDSSSSESTTTSPPPLYLRSLIVCREMREMWPRGSSSSSSFIPYNNEMANNYEALFGVPGADNGLYDPPPVGTDQQATQYMQLDFDGHATALFPYKIDQVAVDDDDRGGWVFSLDWTPGAMRYQVDRKIHGGKQLLGLRTLELSEVLNSNAEIYRPRDGGQNMRQ